MIPTLLVISAVILVAAAYAIKRVRDRRELERYSVTPEALHAMLASHRDVVVLDVRLPLDLLAKSEIIPGATRIAPHEVQENPALIPQDRDVIVYCTCPSEKTSRAILHKALALHLSRVKFLKGGLDGWKDKGYPVEPYTQSFHLETGS